MTKEISKTATLFFLISLISLFPGFSYAQRARAYERPPITHIEPVPAIKIPRYLESVPSLQGKAYEAPTNPADRKWRSFVERQSNKPMSKASAAVSRQFEADAEANHYISDKEISLISIIPESQAEFKSIFGKESRPKDIEVVNQADARIRSISSNRINAFDIKSLDISLATSESKIIVFIAHNEKGRMVLRDGSKVSIRELRDVCVDLGKYCIFISCESNLYLGDGGYGVSKRITYEDAGEFASEIAQFHKFAARNNLKNQEVALLLPGLMEELGGKVSANVKITVIGAGIGGGFVILVQVYDE